MNDLGEPDALARKPKRDAAVGGGAGRSGVVRISERDRLDERSRERPPFVEKTKPEGSARGELQRVGLGHELQREAQNAIEAGRSQAVARDQRLGAARIDLASRFGPRRKPGDRGSGVFGGAGTAPALALAGCGGEVRRFAAA